MYERGGRETRKSRTPRARKSIGFRSRKDDTDGTLLKYRAFHKQLTDFEYLFVFLLVRDIITIFIR